MGGRANTGEALVQDFLPLAFWPERAASPTHRSRRVLHAGAPPPDGALSTPTSGLRMLWGAVRRSRLDPFALFLLALFGAGLTNSRCGVVSPGRA